VRSLGKKAQSEELIRTFGFGSTSQGDLSEWVSLLKKIQGRRIIILAFANNHYAGFGPGTVDVVRRLWGIEAPRVVHPPERTGQQHSLFD
jgi:hypothetical protein